MGHGHRLDYITSVQVSTPLICKRGSVTTNIVVNRVFHKDSYMSLLKSNLTTINFRYFIMGPAYRLQRSPPLRGDPPTHHFQVVTGYGISNRLFFLKYPARLLRKTQNFSPLSGINTCHFRQHFTCQIGNIPLAKSATFPLAKSATNRQHSSR